MKFKWNFILIFCQIKKKIKLKKFFFKKQSFRLGLKHCFLQEIKLLSYDMYNYSDLDYFNYFFLTKNNFKFNVHIKIKIGYGKSLLVFFFLLDKLWKITKKNCFFFYLSFISLKFYENREVGNQIYKMAFKSESIFNFWNINCYVFSNCPQKHGFCVPYLIHIKIIKMLNELINKNSWYILENMMEKQIPYHVYMQFKYFFLFLLKKKSRFFYINSKNFFYKLMIHPIIYEQRQQTFFYDNTVCIYKKNFSKIIALFKYLNKKCENYVIFLDNIKRCIWLKKILETYFKELILCAFDIYEFFFRKKSLFGKNYIFLFYKKIIFCPGCFVLNWYIIYDKKYEIMYKNIPATYMQNGKYFFLLKTTTMQNNFIKKKYKYVFFFIFINIFHKFFYV
nr:hypothetical protein CparaKRNrm1_p015 [Cryptomonas paramecium]